MATAEKTTKKPAEKKAVTEIALFDLSGKQTGTQPVSAAVFGQKENKSLISQYVYIYLQNQRQGNASSKGRSEVIGSTRKIYRQKGTGNARHGSNKAPIFVGGGVAFGPKPADHSRSMNKKQKKQALFISLSMKAKEGAIRALSSEALDIKPKTKQIADFIHALKLEGKKIVFVMSEVKKAGFVLSARNIDNVEFVQANTINPYLVLNTQEIIFVGDAITALENHYHSTNENK